ncbi:MAG: hypothetical protein IKM28_00185 [Lachnospiraceae bacterium]|nr:hypothetical protein [Lachnospiraceae bacterium]
MSKINAVRFINLNYNNNTIHISDETFQLNGESTLFSLRNGGGKSVLVQMLMAPFVHKRYQSTKDRPFASYFTTNKPTFILIEWKLDQGAGYVMTGMMVRKNQEVSQEQPEDLEVIHFISEYKESCPQDIHHLPVVEKGKKEAVLKGFHVCKQLFEGFKRERRFPFFYYDMNNSAQSRQYFDKLAEYQIHYKEWETIIKKINLKESGLSDLFADCKDEKGLVEKWFLEAVENKLNKEKNRMKEFQGILEKYTGQYRDNRSKIQRRDAIRAFVTEAGRIQSSVEQYQQVTEALELQKGRIADFIRCLKEMCSQEEEKAKETGERIEELFSRLEQLEYERLSGKIYEMEDKEKISGSSLDLLCMEKEGLERIRDRISYKLHVLACAKQQELLEEARAEREVEKQRLALCREKEENLEPERQKLGSSLRKYYEKYSRIRGEEKHTLDTSIKSMEEEKSQLGQQMDQLRREEGRLSVQAGALEAGVKTYDRMEEEFNQEYQEAWCRNILGEYEAGTLPLKQSEYESRLVQLEQQRITVKKEAEAYREQRRSLQRLVEDRAEERVRLETRLQESQRQLQEYEQELADRRIILQYLGLEESWIFDREKLLTAAARKLTDTDLARQELEKEADALEKEYRRLVQGQVLELSEEFTTLLEEAGIHFVYGMEWIKKNGYTPEHNERLVSLHPFLPYSLIVSAQELKRLAALPGKVYTSAPVPILVREELTGKELPEEGTIHSFTGVSFYLWFNYNLLDEERLQELLEEKSHRLRKLQEAVERKKQEYAEYIGKQEKLRNQKVTRSFLETVKEEISRQEEELEGLSAEVLKKRQELESAETLQTKREQQITGLEREILQQKRLLADFEKLCAAYTGYLENRRLLEKNRKEKERLTNQQRIKQEKISRLEQEMVSTGNRLRLLERELEECAARLIRYQQYGEGAEGQPLGTLQLPGKDEQVLKEIEWTAEEAASAESRYEAITSGINAQQKDLEERVERAEKRYVRAEEELNALWEKFQLAEQDWQGTAYDKKEELHQEGLLEEQYQKLVRKQEMIQQEEVKFALLKQEKERMLAELKEKCAKDAPMDRAEIQTLDFQEELKKLGHKKNEMEQVQQQILKKLQEYHTLLTALAEYEELECPSFVEWEVDFSAMSGAELTRHKGILIRDLNAFSDQCREARAGLERLLLQISRMDQFAEDFYQKPLEAMLQLTADGDRVGRQLETTLSAYDNLMEKLLVDISLVEREKEKIVELMEDYLREVHENLDKIDNNSTITIRQKPVKMLKVELPSWEENESFYQLRLEDYIDDITTRGIALMDANKNIQEYLGTRVTTRGLYDAVVGLGSVQLRLYKIEEQKEYPITWTDVSRNSGGEGFLSAFVILSALLYYMRRDDTDLFADRNEGKVLLMDNPFAQTNASHLLKPLMDMAKKSNTQLICLSGLGGESIYNRFDNIYVLTLIAANLRSNMQYVKAEHMRGEKEEVLVSQIEVMEQQELIF